MNNRLMTRWRRTRVVRSIHMTLLQVEWACVHGRAEGPDARFTERRFRAAFEEERIRVKNVQPQSVVSRAMDCPYII